MSKKKEKTVGNYTKKIMKTKYNIILRKLYAYRKTNGKVTKADAVLEKANINKTRWLSKKNTDRLRKVDAYPKKPKLMFIKTKMKKRYMELYKLLNN